MFTLDCIAAMQAHALTDYPRESCGVVRVGGSYEPQPNLAAEPERDFRMPDSVWGGGILAVVHSHPGGPACPSELDMRQQIASGLPWAILVCNGTDCREPIVWGEGAPVPPLLERHFVHGVTDCYELARDYYRTVGVQLPAVPRQDDWWLDTGPNHFLQGFAEAGFRSVPLPHARPHDAVLMQMGRQSNGPDHCGVILPDDLLLHHLPNRLSRREPIGPWRRKITHVLRHGGATC